MTHHDTRQQILNWAGGEVAFTDEDMERFVPVWERVVAMYPDPDEQEERDAALTTATQIILGETTLEAAGLTAMEAETAVVRARAARAGAILVSQGTDSEVGIADRARTSRVTVRKVLGK